MFHKDRRSRAAVAVALMALLATLAAAVPLLDRGSGVGPYAVSDGEAPVGWIDHDHRICLQHSAMAWLPGMGVNPPVVTTRIADRPGVPTGERPDLAPPSSHHPRAPPRL